MCHARDGYKANLMYHVDEDLSVISTEMAEHLDLVLAGENCLDERDDFRWMQWIHDQTFPGGSVGVDRLR